MTRDEARVLISGLIEWYTEDLGERLGLSMGKDAYMDALETLWHGPEGELISRADAISIPVLPKEHRKKFNGIDDAFETGWNEALACVNMLPSAEAVTHGRLIDADALSEKLCETTIFIKDGEVFQRMINDAPTVSAEAVQGWIPCSERLPKINQEVLLSTADGKVFVGHREKPYLVWQVTETDGRKHWVYDPEAYTDDVDGLPKAEDCGFDKDSPYSDGLLSVTSVNYDNRFDGVTAWMPLPTPYKGGDYK